MTATRGMPRTAYGAVRDRTIALWIGTERARIAPESGLSGLDQRLRLTRDREQHRQSLRAVAGAELRDDARAEQEFRPRQKHARLAADAEHPVLADQERETADGLGRRQTVGANLELPVVDDADIDDAGDGAA